MGGLYPLVASESASVVELDFRIDLTRMVKLMPPAKRDKDDFRINQR